MMFQKLRSSVSKKKEVEDPSSPRHCNQGDKMVGSAEASETESKPETETETDPSTTANSDAASRVGAANAADNDSLQASPSSSLTLLEELADALIGAVAVYGMADVRSLLRASQNGTSSSTASTSPLMSGDPELLRKAMELPITRSEMMQLLQLNLDALHQNKIPADLYLSLLDSFGSGGGASVSSGPSPSNETVPSSGNGDGDDTSNATSASATNAKWLLSIFKNIPMPAALSSSTVQQQQQGEGDAQANDAGAAMGTDASPPPSVYVAVFDDENSNKELVYYIAVDEYVNLCWDDRRLVHPRESDGPHDFHFVTRTQGKEAHQGRVPGVGYRWRLDGRRRLEDGDRPEPAQRHGL
jgi:hypothetical protein